MLGNQKKSMLFVGYLDLAIIRAMEDNPQDPYLQQPSGEYSEPIQPVRKRSPKVLAILGGIGCLLLTLIGVGLIYFFISNLGKEELQMVNDQLGALRRNDIDRAYSYCSIAFQKSTSRDDFLRMVEDYPVLKNAKEFSSMDRSKNVGGLTILKGTITGEDGSKLPAEYQLVRENDKWKIQSLKLSPSGMSVENPAAPQQMTPKKVAPVVQTPPPAPVIKNLQITNVLVHKEPQKDSFLITVDFQVMNFANDKTSGSARIHLVQDLKTIEPNGDTVPKLSKDAMNVVKESGEPEYKSIDFQYKLSVPSNSPTGRYQMVITVHDRIGGGAAAATAQFDVP
jgi:Domain of unknown function (DUF4864)